jgi:hypothetical protein
MERKLAAEHSRLRQAERRAERRANVKIWEAERKARNATATAEWYARKAEVATALSKIEAGELIPA